MKFSAVLTMMLLAASALFAKVTKIDQDALMERARTLDHYATLSGQEMIQKTDEIHDLIGELKDIVASDVLQVNHDVKRQILERIQAYRKAESAQMATLDRTTTTKQ